MREFLITTTRPAEVTSVYRIAVEDNEDEMHALKRLHNHEVTPITTGVSHIYTSDSVKSLVEVVAVK